VPGELLADTASPWLAAHTAWSCVWEASNVDIAFQKGSAVVAFLAARKKKRCANISSTCCAHKGRARAGWHGATTPIKGKKNGRAHLRL